MPRAGRRLVRPVLVALMTLALAGSFWHVRDELVGPEDRAGARVATAPRAAPATVLDRTAPGATDVPEPGVDALAEGSADALGKLAGQAERLNERTAEPPVTEFVVGSYNVLGSSHTGRGAARAHLGDGSRRLARAIGLIRARGVDVAGLQEFQQGQRETFARQAGGEYGMYPPLSASRKFGQNSVVWRLDRFELVEGGSVGYPYFSGRLRPYPQILLREKRTGVQFYVTSYHNPADRAGHGNQARNRGRALAMQVANAETLLARTRRPLIITGDMNARGDYVCPMVARTEMRPAQGGGCQAPQQGIDWLMGSSKVAFSDYVQDDTPRRAGLSDHPLITARARVTGLPGDRREALDPYAKAP